MTSNNQKKLEQVAKWYSTKQGLNSFMIYCVFLEFKKYIKDPLLEVGAADGYMTKLILQNCSIDDYDIVEASFSYANVLSKKFPHINIINSHLEKVKKVKKYKTIIISHILEHIENPQFFLRKAYDLLDDSGKLLVSVPNALSIHRLLGVEMGLLNYPNELNEQDKMIGHYRVYDKKILAEHLKKAGFKIELLSTSFLKFLSNSQTEKYIHKKNWIYFYKLSKKFPDFGADLYVVCKK